MNELEKFGQLMIKLKIGRGLTPEDEKHCKSDLEKLSEKLGGKDILDVAESANNYLKMEEPDKAWKK